MIWLIQDNFKQLSCSAVNLFIFYVDHSLFLVEQDTPSVTPPPTIVRSGHRRNVSDTSALLMKDPNRESAFRYC